MRKFFILQLMLTLCISFAHSKINQTQGNTDASMQKSDSLSRMDTLVMINNEILEQIEIDLSLKNRFKIYQTENIYQLLKLDTKTGKVYQIQWSLKEEEEMTLTINSKDLRLDDRYGSGCFELYPTKNMYQFILIDKTDGRTWHVQWGTEPSKRWIRKIY